jgi:tetratricopeptide (TPR) repeat protein
MKLVVCFFVSVFCLVSSAQVNPELAKEYYQKGEFEKALVLYKKLLVTSSLHPDYNIKLIDCHQQLNQLKAAQEHIETQIFQSRHPQFLVELGYNYQLQNKLELANFNYDRALLLVEEEPKYVYGVAQRFESHSLISQAIQSYEIGLAVAPNATYYYQLAGLYAAKQNIEKMMERYMDYVKTNPPYMNQVMRLLADYISEDSSQPYNQLFKKVLLKKSQATPDPLWNKWLSWLYVQQKQFSKAFVQEKAVYRRTPESLQGLIDLAVLANQQKAYKTALNVFEFIIQNSTDSRFLILANCKLLEIKLDIASDSKSYQDIKASYVVLLDRYQLGQQSIELQLSYAHFLAFYDNNTQGATIFLKTALKENLSVLSAAKLKMKLADLFVVQNKFNQALVYYTQIQMAVKNSPLAQQARFKVAKTSYYKGDFDWAETQLKVLKSSTSQLTANDALQLQLLITDHIGIDSLNSALKRYAKADLLSVQNKPKEALMMLDSILKDYNTNPIIDQVLLFQAQLYESQKQYMKAASNYLQIIKDHKKEILVDDAYFFLAELYRTHLEDLEKAKFNYESIIFNHEDSIHFVEARHQYRILRGDLIN